jgi:hypothetical protein
MPDDDATKERTRLFRRWLRAIGDDLDEAQRLTGVGRRSLERMKAGAKPPPLRLLEDLATDAAARGRADLAGELAAAATPSEGSHA